MESFVIFRLDSQLLVLKSIEAETTCEPYKVEEVTITSPTTKYKPARPPKGSRAGSNGMRCSGLFDNDATVHYALSGRAF